MKKLLFLLTLLTSVTVHAQDLTKEYFYGKWDGCDSLQMEFKMENGELWSYAVIPNVMNNGRTDDITLIQGILYVDFVVERRNGKKFSEDFSANNTKQDNTTSMAASLIGKSYTQPSQTESPNYSIIRRVRMSLKPADNNLLVEWYEMEEREGYGNIEYAYKEGKNSCILKRK